MLEKKMVVLLVTYQLEIGQRIEPAKRNDDYGTRYVADKMGPHRNEQQIHAGDDEKNDERNHEKGKEPP